MTEIVASHPKLLRLLNSHTLFSLSVSRRLCVEATGHPETPTSSPSSLEAEEKPETKRGVVSRALDLIDSENGCCKNSEELRALLFSAPSYSSRHVLHITRRLGSTSKALSFFRWLQSHPQSSDSSSLSSAFQAIIELARDEPDLQKRFLELSAMAKEHNVPLSLKSAALLIRSFRRAGMGCEALSFYNQLNPSLKNIVTFNALLDALLRLGRFEDAVKVLDEMLRPAAAFPPNGSTGKFFFDAVLKLNRLGRGVNVEKVVLLVSKLGERSVFPDPMQLSRMINWVSSRGGSAAAWDVLHAVLKFNGPVVAQSCNALLTALRNDRAFERMSLLFEEMKDKNIQPDVVTSGILINHLCKQRRVDAALEVLEKMRGGEGGNWFSVKPDVITYNTLIDGLCKVGRQDKGFDLIQKMKEDGCFPNTVTYNCLIDGFCKVGEMDRSQQLFDEMNNEGVLVNVVTVNTMVDGMCRRGRISSALKFFREMQGKGLKGNAVTYTLFIKAFCNSNNTTKAKELFDEMINAGCAADDVVYYSMISGLVLAGKVDDASLVALEMKKAGFEMDTVSYNVLIGGFCRKNKVQEANKLFKEMEEVGVKRDNVTYNTMISYLSKHGDFKTAEKVMREMIDDDLTPTIVTFGSLIHAFCLHGNLDKAMDLFRKMCSISRIRPNTVIYNMLIDSLCKNNELETALTLLDDMKKKEVKSNTTTYNAVFKGLQEKNWLKKAFELMNTMTQEGCKPDFITMEILTEWLCYVGETAKLKTFVEGHQISVAAEENVAV